LETNDAGEEEMKRNNRASQNSQRVVELKKKMNFTSNEDIATKYEADIPHCVINVTAS